MLLYRSVNWNSSVRIIPALLLICSIAACLIGCGTKNEQFLIEGTLTNASHVQTVLLYEGDRKLDSVFVDERGKFRMKRVASQPRLFTLVAGRNNYPVILTNGETLTFQADLNDPKAAYTVSGSALSEKIQGFAQIQQERVAFERQMDEDFLALTANLSEQAIMAMRDEFMGKYRRFMKSYIEKTVAFAEENPDLAGFYAMTTLDPEMAESELIAYAEQIEGKYEQNAVVRDFLERVSDLKRLAVGQPAPAFESLTSNNRRVQLSDFKGKYTLVDFWASWCVPCREENPNLVKQYERFKDRGFTILGVSLDGNPGSWLRAVEEDGLEWLQVSDLQAWKSPVIQLYNIKAIPTSYLLDPEGVILAKNLRAKELEDFLIELFETR